jgi:hypothetical protein
MNRRPRQAPAKKQKRRQLLPIEQRENERHRIERQLK